MRIAIVGVTGIIGQYFLRVLEERSFPVTELIPYASVKSAGQKVTFSGNQFSVIGLCPENVTDCDIAFFSAGAGVSLEYAQLFTKKKALVIDNSSAFRSDKKIPLIVPEVNPQAVTIKRGIIANPNCSTIGIVTAINPLHRRYGLKKMVVTNLQSVSGAGRKALSEYRDEISGQRVKEKVFQRQIAGNLIPQIGSFTDAGITEEELKVRDESRKILGIPQLEVSATAVRVPVEIGHCSVIHAEFQQEPDIIEVRDILEHAPGVKLLSGQDYITPFEIAGKPSWMDGIANHPQLRMKKAARGLRSRYLQNNDEVFISRVRIPEGFANCLDMWVCSDNLRKGAALNAIQIAELVFRLY